MMNKIGGLVAAALLGGITGGVYAGGINLRTTSDECGKLPPVASQVCQAWNLKGDSDKAMTYGALPGAIVFSVIYLLFVSKKLKSDHLTLVSTAILVVLFATNLQTQAPATATSVSPSGLEVTPRRKAFLNTIAFAEGTYGKANSGYFTNFGGSQFQDCKHHPQKSVGFTQTNGVPEDSDAAGRYQFISTTYAGIQKAFPEIKTFCADDQDKAAIALLNEKHVGALVFVDAGNFDQAIYAASRTWASFPKNAQNGKHYPQPIKTIQTLRAFYEQQKK